MLYLLLEVAGQQYAVEASRVVEVLPLVQVTVIPRAPTEVAGIFSFRGRPVPLVDLRRLTLRRPARPKFSTRIILVADRAGDGSEQLVGIIAERVTETTRRAPEDFKRHRLRQPRDAVSRWRRHRPPAASSSAWTSSNCSRRPRGRCSFTRRPVNARWPQSRSRSFCGRRSVWTPTRSASRPSSARSSSGRPPAVCADVGAYLRARPFVEGRAAGAHRVRRRAGDVVLPRPGCVRCALGRRAPRHACRWPPSRCGS